MRRVILASSSSGFDKARISRELDVECLPSWYSIPATERLTERNLLLSAGMSATRICSRKQTPAVTGLNLPLYKSSRIKATGTIKSTGMGSESVLHLIAISRGFDRALDS